MNAQTKRDPAPILQRLNFEACLFDFDGVIVNSEPLHAQAKQATLQHFGVQFPASLLSDFKGRPDKDFFAHVVERYATAAVNIQELEAYKRHAYLQLFENVPLVDGVIEFLAAVRKKFNKTGLATSATQRDFSLAAGKFKIDAGFNVIITREDTQEHKPHPQPYLKALTALNATAGQTLVVEDSPNGILAAKNAGCVTAALTTTFDEQALLAAGADLVVASFAELRTALEL